MSPGMYHPEFLVILSFLSRVLGVHMFNYIVALERTEPILNARERGENYTIKHNMGVGRVAHTRWKSPKLNAHAYTHTFDEFSYNAPALESSEIDSCWFHFWKTKSKSKWMCDWNARHVVSMGYYDQYIKIESTYYVSESEFIKNHWLSSTVKRFPKSIYM